MRVEAFVIHLARAEQRRRQVEKLQRDLPMPVHVLNAIDGREMHDEEIEAVYRPNLLRPHYPFVLGRGEVACFLSHRAAWQEIVDRNLDAGLIVEDDIEIDPVAFGKLWVLVQNSSTPAHFVRFPQRVRGEAGATVAKNGDCLLLRPVSPALGMIMQLVGRQAAIRLLDLTKCFDRPVDAVLQMRWMHEIPILSARPVVVTEISEKLGGSLAQSGGKGLGRTLDREVRRPIYRASVRVHNFLHGR